MELWWCVVLYVGDVLALGADWQQTHWSTCSRLRTYHQPGTIIPLELSSSHLCNYKWSVVVCCVCSVYQYLQPRPVPEGVSLPRPLTTRAPVCPSVCLCCCVDL